ncbi:hypothetical protein BRADI_2g56804v3 [Brachypodium distachyon]|uniref:Uncharacterized protein n=1 Tax=Brachypodium distachyon TaxID=15368 RepID=A0A2K2DGA7_BRADI|nr:hypothetical protein BRADI_2g56804v3 [Brachypodium distachyon]
MHAHLARLTRQVSFGVPVEKRSRGKPEKALRIQRHGTRSWRNQRDTWEHGATPAWALGVKEKRKGNFDLVKAKWSRRCLCPAFWTH